jgi:hypothetical protein
VPSKWRKSWAPWLRVATAAHNNCMAAGWRVARTLLGINPSLQAASGFWTHRFAVCCCLTCFEAFGDALLCCMLWPDPDASCILFAWRPAWALCDPAGICHTNLGLGLKPMSQV